MTTRALVLGGGGVTGVAWEIGLLAGLAARGVQVGGADLIVGTSAGSVVGAQLACGTNLDQMYADQLQPPVVWPDRAAKAAIGRNVLDPARRAPAARAGHAQSGSALDRVAAVWG